MSNFIKQPSISIGMKGKVKKIKSYLGYQELKTVLDISSFRFA